MHEIIYATPLCIFPCKFLQIFYPFKVPSLISRISRIFYFITLLPLKLPRRSHPAKYGEGFDARADSLSPTDFTDSHRLVASYPQAQWSQKQAVARRFQPAKYGEGFDAPPTLERSGSEHRRAVTSLALLERARAWEWVKDPPAGEGQVGQKHLFG